MKRTPSIEDLLAQPFEWPDVRDLRTLVVGIGGGSDAIVAFAIARMLDSGPTGAVAYANAKHDLDEDLIEISPRIGRLPDDAPIRGRTKIERRLPRGPLGSPLILALGRDDDDGGLLTGLSAFEPDRVIAVDTGGDALDARPRAARGRDRRMLATLRRLGVPTLLVVVAPGADGQMSSSALETACAAEHDAGRFRGGFSLEPLLSTLREHGRALGGARTPNIIACAFDDPTDPVEIPRGCRPRIPRRWLMSGLVFEASTQISARSASR